MRRAQLFSQDIIFAIALVLFILSIWLVLRDRVLHLISTSEDKREIDEAASNALSQLLETSGKPTNWDKLSYINDSTVENIGLVSSRNTLDSEKVEKFVRLANGKNSSASLVALWHFDEGSGTTISDSSGNGNTGSFSTTGSFPVWAAGRFGYGVSFDPAYASNIVAGDSPSLDISGPITVEAWFSAYYLYYSHGHWLLNKGSSSSDGNYHIWIDNTYKVHAAIGNGTDSQAVISASTLQPDTWYHVAFTANGTTDSNGVLKLYINGILDNSSVQTMTPLSNGLDLVIGSMTYTILFYPLNGTIDEIAIYSRAKTADEIAADANPLHISLDVRDALNNSVNVRGASSGYVNPTANNTFYLKTDDAGSLNMTAGAYSGFYSLRLHVNNTKVNLLLKTVQEGVSSIQVVIPVELRIYQQLFPNLIVTGK